MSEENLELVRRNYEVINSLGRTEGFVDPEEIAPDVTKITAVGRGSDVPAELDETDVFWFRNGLITRMKGYATKEEALEAAESSE